MVTWSRDTRQAIGIHMFMANIKGNSSMQPRRELKIGQKAAWFMLHRLRTALETGEKLFSGPVEADENSHGGSRKNMSNAKRKELKESGAGCGAVGKTAIVGVKDRATGKVVAQVVKDTSAATLQGFVEGQTEPDAMVYTDEAAAHAGIIACTRWSSTRSPSMSGTWPHTNSIESFWSMLERGYQGVDHKMSPKHLHHHVDEFAGRHNIREADTMAQIREVAARMVGKRIMYRKLIADNGLSSGAGT